MTAQLLIRIAVPVFFLGAYFGAFVVLAAWAFVPWRAMRRALVRDGRGPKVAS